MDPFASIVDLVLLIAVLATLGHIGLCAVFPYKACRRCDGKGRIFGPFASVRFCPVCAATGVRLRFGRRIWNRIRFLYRSNKRYRDR